MAQTERGTAILIFLLDFSRLKNGTMGAFDTGYANALRDNMLRITEYLENDKAIRLRLDGTLSSQSFDGVAQLCARHQSHAGQTIIVDMAGVNFMHDEAARKLARLRTESVRVINCSPFIAALLDTAKNLE